MGTRRTMVTSVVFSLVLMSSLSCDVFGSSENWVEVTSFSGGGSSFGFTPFFTINHNEWRIRWEYAPLFLGVHNEFDFWVVPEENRIEGQFLSGMGIASVNHPSEKNGTLYFSDMPGEFFLYFAPGSTKWTVIVEQNIDSIPEFPSWPILPIVLVLTLIAIIIRNKIGKEVLK